MSSYIPFGPFLVGGRRARARAGRRHAAGRARERRSRFDRPSAGCYRSRAMHPAMQRRRRHLMMRADRAPRLPASAGLATFLLVALGVFGLMFVGSVLGTAGGMFAAYNYFATGLPDPRILDNPRSSPPSRPYVYDRTGRPCSPASSARTAKPSTVSFAQIPIVTPRSPARTGPSGRTTASTSRARSRAVLRQPQGRRDRAGRLDDHPAGDRLRRASLTAEGAVDRRSRPAASHRGQRRAPNPDDAATRGNDPAEQEPTSASLRSRPSRPIFEDKIRENILATQVTAPYPGREGKEQILDTYLNLDLLRQRLVRHQGRGGELLRHHRSRGPTLAAGRLPLGAAAGAELPRSLPEPKGRTRRARRPRRASRVGSDAMLRRALHHAAQQTRERATTWPAMDPSRVTSTLREPHFTFRVRERGGAHPRQLGCQIPALELRHRRLQDHHHDRPRPPGGGQRRGREVGGHAGRQERRTTARWSRSTRRPARSSPTSDRSTTTTARTPASRASSTSPGLGRRQPGSAFKPITYSSAFKARQATVGDDLVDSVTQFGQTPAPLTARRTPTSTTTGPLLATDALRNSLNVPSVQMQFLVGAQTHRPSSRRRSASQATTTSWARIPD